MIYRSLNVDRDSNFLRASTDFVEDIIKEPCVKYKQPVTRQGENGPYVEEVERKRSYTNAEIAFRYYVLVNVLQSHEEQSI